MPIELILHKATTPEGQSYQDLKAYLSDLPNAVPEGDDFVFCDEEQGLYVVVQIGNLDGESFHPGPNPYQQCNAILIRIPNDPPNSLIEPLAEFAFNIARRFGWAVYERSHQTPIADEQSLAKRLSGLPVPLPVASSGCMGIFVLLLALLLLNNLMLSYH
ncbi:hypothetical protein [Chthonomonas calidirosea]|uniref:hypothetical protein n=1 Tax=Chthonomonas calidirosea TaxID=454171 RepID=UPI0006EC7527|nr:hypothetical protein [Chthonomonas calidirosea]CEK14401.1 hypothetical protein CP488_00826 [Chthonomonas calidirosea]